MQSLRVRLITWYVGVGAIVVVCISLLAAAAIVEAVSFEARQTLAQAAREAPRLVEAYSSTHHEFTGIEQYLEGYFAPRGVTAHVMLKSRFFGQDVPPPPGHLSGGPDRVFAFGAQRGAVIYGPFRRTGERVRPPSFFITTLAMAIKPVSASFNGGEVILFVDPGHYKNLFGILGLFVLILAAVILPAAWRIAVTVAENTLEPLLRTTKALNRFGSGDFTPEALSTNDRSELGELAHAYNRAVAQITRAFDERSKAEAEMRQFVGDAGHQLRTPLTVIMGYLSGMVHRAQPLAQAETYATMLSQARRMRSLIDDLITLARLEHPSTSPATIVDLNEICTHVPASFDEASQKRIHVLPVGSPAFAAGNEADIAGALCALVDNALKYAPQSPVALTISRDGSHWVVSVADSGPGMTGNDLRSAYDRFYRGSAAEGIEGTGLGLPIVRKSIERAGGSVFLCNRTAGGLLCTIRLVAVSVPATAAEAQ